TKTASSIPTGFCFSPNGPLVKSGFCAFFLSIGRNGDSPPMCSGVQRFAACSGNACLSQCASPEHLLQIGGEIPYFPVGTVGLGLKGRRFKTGTIIKLYSY